MLCLDGVRRLNSYEATGNHGVRCCALDELVLEHLQTQRELQIYTAREQQVLRLAAEGYSNAAIAAETGVSLSTVARKLYRYRRELLARDPRAA